MRSIEFARAALATAVLTAAVLGCGTEPEPHLLLSGRVVSATSGAGISTARVELWFAKAFEPAYMWKVTYTDDTAAFAFDIEPPPGYSFPNCVTLHLEVSANGFLPTRTLAVGPSDCCCKPITLTIKLKPAQ